MHTHIVVVVVVENTSNPLYQLIHK